MTDTPSPTDLELFARVESAPPGTFRMFSAIGAGIEERIRQHLKNMDELHGLIGRSASGGFYVESISLRLQVVDYWLRIYLANQAPGTKRRREFGALLDHCLDAGLDRDIHDRLTAANLGRIDAIHGLVVGSISYEDLSTASEDWGHLVKDVVRFVTHNSGTIVTHRDQLAANPGACTLHVDDFCREVDAGIRY